MKLITALKDTNKDPIPAATCTKAIKLFIKYVNDEKRRVAPHLHKSHDSAWIISRQQDASESMNYFLDMIAAADEPTKAIPALQETNKNSTTIKAMQYWITQQFRFSTGEKLFCTKTKQARFASKEKHYVLSLDLNVNTQRQSGVVSLQELIDRYFATESVEDVMCEKCGKKHDFAKKTVIEGAGEHLLLSLERFKWCEATSKTLKLETVVDFAKPVSLRVKNKQIIYKTKAVINHRGVNFDSGHYTLDKDADGCIP